MKKHNSLHILQRWTITSSHIMQKNSCYSSDRSRPWCSTVRPKLSTKLRYSLYEKNLYFKQFSLYDCGVFFSIYSENKGKNGITHSAALQAQHIFRRRKTDNLPWFNHLSHFINWSYEFDISNKKCLA